MRPFPASNRRAAPDNPTPTAHPSKGHTMLIRDVAAATSKEVTPEGFLRVRARIGRSGLHDYRAAELGRPQGFAPRDLVRVYRPPEEVFDAASMASFGAKPVTLDHPPGMVDASNWRRYAIGQSGHAVTREGDHLATDLLIADQGGIERALAGAELSNGYVADFIFEPGETPEGDPYDAVQRSIRGNHIALVDAGRCGASCRIGDADPCGCGTHAAETEGDLRRQLAALEAAHAQALEAKDGALAALAAQLPDAATLDALVAERASVVEAARRALGPSFDPAGRSTADIRRLAVVQMLGPDRVRDRGDAYVTAAFDALASARPAGNPLAAQLAAGERSSVGSRDALDARNRHLTSAWREGA